METARWSRSTAVRRGAAAGAGAGLLACAAGAVYLAEDASIPGISWPIVAAVFVTQLALTGALLGGVVSAAKAAIDRRTRGRTWWAPALAAVPATALVAAPSGAFGAAYFGALHAPFMGSALIFAISGAIAVSLAAALAWLDQLEDRSQLAAPRLRRAVLAAVGLALPLAAMGAMGARALPDDELLEVLRHTSPALVGGAAGAGLGLVFGLYAEEDAELEARFAELDRAERRG